MSKINPQIQIALAGKECEFKFIPHLSLKSLTMEMLVFIHITAQISSKLGSTELLRSLLGYPIALQRIFGPLDVSFFKCWLTRSYLGPNPNLQFLKMKIKYTRWWEFWVDCLLSILWKQKIRKRFSIKQENSRMVILRAWLPFIQFFPINSIFRLHSLSKSKVFCFPCLSIHQQKGSVLGNV